MNKIICEPCFFSIKPGMFTFYISADQRHIQFNIYVSYLSVYSSFSRLLQYVSYHVHTTAEYHVGRWRAWWWNYTAAKWKTAIPDCLSTFVSAKPKETCSFKGLHIHGWQKCTSLTFILATELIQSNCLKCSQCIREI